MMKAKGLRSALGIFIILATPFSFGIAQESDDSEDESRFTVDGSWTWMGTRGNDLEVGQTVALDLGVDRERGATLFEEDVSSLVTKMRNKAAPWARIGFEYGKWGVSAELWTLDTDGSTETGDEPFEAFRYHDLLDTTRPYDIRLRAANRLSAWTVRMALTRELSMSLTLGVGLQAGELENRRNETLELTSIARDPFFFTFSENNGVLTTESRTAGSLLGPSVDLRGSAKLGGPARVQFVVAQSVLFSTFENETLWQSEIEALDFFGFDEPMRRVETLTFDSATRVAIPVTDARAAVSFDLGAHVSLGVLGLLSVWFDAPLASRYSQATGGWEPVSSTLVFASIGPLVTVRF